MSIFALAVGLGLMLVLVYDMTIFAGYFSGFMILNLWAQTLWNDFFRRAVENIETTSRKGDRVRKDVLEVMKAYWLRRPHRTRIVVITLFSMLSLVAGVVSNTTAIAWKHQLETFGYVILILTIVIGEAVIGSWRRARDRQLQYYTETPGKTR